MEHLAKGVEQRYNHDVKEANLRLGDTLLGTIKQRADGHAILALNISLTEELLLQLVDPPASK